MKLTYEQMNALKTTMLKRKGLRMNFPGNKHLKLSAVYREPYDNNEAEEFKDICEQGVDEEFALSKYSGFTLMFVHEHKVLHSTHIEVMNLDEMIKLNPDIEINL